MFADITTTVRLNVTKIVFEEFVSKVKHCNSIVNYNRHPPTNQLLAKYISFTTAAEYKLDIGDRIFVVGLKTRAPVSGQDVSVTENDLIVLEVLAE
jgi:hypothetical protein